jgi:hypothetical protein
VFSEYQETSYSLDSKLAGTLRGDCLGNMCMEISRLKILEIFLNVPELPYETSENE